MLRHLNFTIKNTRNVQFFIMCKEKSFIMGKEETIILAEIDHERIKRVREKLPSVADRKMELYATL